jgi:uncharacterized YigZ family protein
MSYTSIRQDVVTELEIKKSRFITWVSPVSSQSEAEQKISASRQRWPGATHYCFAWITLDPLMERCSDDGEPSGTAGVPILTVLKNRGLGNILTVVVRYFGGTLLGASGLVRAYSDSTRHALEQADIVNYENGLLINLIIEYTDFGLIQHRFLSAPEVSTQGIEYGEQVTISATLSLTSWAKWEREITEMTSGRAKYQIIAERIVAV